MATLGHTWHVRLTKASDANTVYDFLLQEGADGEPAVRLGQTPKEAAPAGVYDTIRIESLHHGSGQYLARDPMMYEFADGMWADKPGVFRTGGAMSSAGGVSSSGVAFRAWQRASFVEPVSGQQILITPKSIYEGASIAANAPSGNYYTGSYAILGPRIFFGVATNGGVSHNVTFRDSDTSYNTNGSFKASFLAAQIEKMFVAEQIDAVSNVAIRWTDDTSSNAPTATASYTAQLGMVRDAAVLGSHFVLAVQRPQTSLGHITVMDISGIFTPLLYNIRAPRLFTPFLGGQILWQGGGIHGLWMPDVGTYRSLALDYAISERWALAQLPHILMTGSTNPAGHTNPGFAAASADNELFLSLYARQLVARNAAAIEGSIILKAKLTDEGLFAHTIATPEMYSGLTNAHVTALRVAPVSANTGNANTMAARMQVFAATPNSSNASQSNYQSYFMALWDGDTPPANSIGYSNAFLRTSRYEGRHWNTKYFTQLRGHMRPIFDGVSNAYAKIYLDSSETAAANVLVSTNTSTGTFSANIPSGLLGRTIAIEPIIEVAGAPFTAELPWEIDYFAVPSEQDVVRIGILAGADQVQRTGGVTAKTRAALLQQVQAIASSGVEWTLEWWDGMPNWTVMPLSYETNEVEGQHEAGEGSLVAWLTCVRTA